MDFTIDLDAVIQDWDQEQRSKSDEIFKLDFLGTTQTGKKI